MRILFVGDVVGAPGLGALEAHLPRILESRRIDFCIVNAENAADGFGLTESVGTRMFELGADVLTGGNHIWDKKESFGYFDREHRLVRPANAAAHLPGATNVVLEARGGQPVGVINLLGRVFMKPADCPFRGADRVIGAMSGRTSVIVVDMHAEATSEKIALGRYLDGRVSAVLGTHTHVQTADERVLPGGTAYISDVGMTGPYESVIGVEYEQALGRFLDGKRRRLPTASGDPRLSGAVIEVDDATGRASSIERLHMEG